jgi:hypothetical protein
VALEEIDEIDGRRAYRLRVNLSSGEVDHVWIDASSFLEIRYDRPSYGPKEGNPAVSVFYRDYKDFDGLKLPSIIETAAAPGQSPDRMTLERVSINPRIDRYAFSEPGRRGRRGDFARRFPEADTARRPPLPPAASPAAPADGPAASLQTPSSNSP